MADLSVDSQEPVEQQVLDKITTMQECRMNLGWKAWAWPIPTKVERNMALLWIMMWCTISMSMIFPSTVDSAPISIDFDTCIPVQHDTAETIECCPIKPTKPIIDGLPPQSTHYIRSRQAAQCTDADYAAKLARGYDLMRALPDDDPRSLTQQWIVHCAYCGGAFVDPETKTAIDIHFSWLFFPWHRYFLYFHERILQSLLGDPTFSLSYWNWDSPYTVGNRSDEGCFLAGHNFPAAYSNISRSTYDSRRSENAKGMGRLPFPDLSFRPNSGARDQLLFNASAEAVMKNNLKVVNQAMVVGPTAGETFMGRPYRAGDLPFEALEGSGTLALSAHSAIHFWTGQDFSTGDASDLGTIDLAARDPILYAHHANVDRLWRVWRELYRTTLDTDREHFSDPDFLNATFLFYDENRDLRRVKIGDALETENLGYTYQLANDLAWLDISNIDMVAPPTGKFSN